MKISSHELITTFSGLVQSTIGEHQEFDHTASPEGANATSLVFLSDAKDAPSTAAVIVTTADIAQEIKDTTQATLVCVEDVRLSQALIKQYYDDYQPADDEWDDIHSSAVIHKSATLSQGCRVGPNAVIGAHCVLEENVIIRAGAVVEHGSRIGKGSVIHPGANIGYNTQIGERVIVKANAAIGGEGFGFAQDADKRYHRIPHTGWVVLEDEVRIGSNSCVDRGTYGATVIGKGTKIDNLVQVAHNCVVGENVILVSQVGLAGSSTIGARAILSGQVGVLDHKNVSADAVLVHRAGVTQDVPGPGVYAGTPPIPIKEHIRTTRATKRLDRLEKKLRELQDQLESK